MFELRSLAILALPFTALTFGQDLTPRELFFSAPNSPVKVTRPPVSTPVKKTGGKQATPAPKPVETAANTSPLDRASPQQDPSSGDLKIVKASAGGNAPLGLRYSLLSSRDDASYREVDTETTFRSGDRLKVEVESNDDAFLYIVARGTSGQWKVLFPATELNQGDNRIQAFQRLTFPSSGRFYFDEQAGEEKLFLVLSRKPESNFEDLIYKINAPAPGPVHRPRKELQLAQLARPIDDQLVGRIRASLTPRDLVFEKVDDSKPLDDRREKAAYVVNRNAGADGKVIVDLVLKHK